ncbi:MAG: 2-octaprenyl-6-methoxyphenol hydroxylase [Gammaproteobacteria bacterium]|jgi:2-octaprenyl-6-methoxyphenol hydroxylase
MKFKRIVIVGGGLVGLCSALALNRFAERLVILEPGQLLVQPEQGLNVRSIALSASSEEIFKSLGVWSDLSANANPIQHIHVSSAGYFGITRLHANDNGRDSMGHVIEYNALLKTLLLATKKIKHLQLNESTNVKQLLQTDEGCRLIVESQNDQSQEYKADLIVIADGSQSSSRQFVGIEHHQVDYGQSVVIGNITTSKPLNHWAFERFTESGPLALLPLGGSQYSVVWTVKNDQQQTLLSLSDSEFIEKLQFLFGYRLGRIETLGDRFGLPIVRTQAESLVTPSAVVLGNAANALHPVAGQGFNLALRDIACLHDACSDLTASVDSALGLGEALKTYESIRQLEHAKVINNGDSLVSLFSNNLPLLNHARAGALAALDLLPAVKAAIGLTGMGFGFGGNRLLRGRSC